MQQYHLSEQALSLWLNYVEHQVGFILPKSQNNWVKGIIERHMRSLASMTTRKNRLFLLSIITTLKTLSGINLR